MEGRGRLALSFPSLEPGFVPTSNPQTRGPIPRGVYPGGYTLRETTVLDQGHPECGPNFSLNKGTG